ncbi:MAG TPA: polyprenyl synthetase family protein [Devosiaceae bacterium]|jgi:geranylgeranyl pyrophosphate synthase|nr:polyprenyl synthetase family protein [Devosiaceae bacterium]
MNSEVAAPSFPVLNGRLPTDDQPTMATAAAFKDAVDSLRRYIGGTEFGPGLRPLLACLAGPLDQHVVPERPPFLPLILPLLVRGGIDGRAERALPVAVASGLLFLSFDLLDDLQDGDDRRWWRPLSRGELLLAAATFPATLPQRLLLGVGLEAEVAAALSHALSNGLLEIAEGQARDLAGLNASYADPVAVEASVAGKSGAQMGLYARMAALAAGSGEDEAGQWASWAHGIGTAGQLGSDLQDLLDPVWSRDLAAGARTLPIAFALHSLDGDARSELLVLLDAAKVERQAQLQAIEQIRGCGGMIFAAFRSRIHLVRSEQALERLKCPPAWRTLLGRLPAAQTLHDLLGAEAP